MEQESQEVMPNPFQSQTENQSQENNLPETQEPSDFGAQFLQGIDENDQPIVAKYIKQWDGQVTKKFQEYAGKLKDYEALGDPSSLTSAQQLLQDIQNDPVEFFKYYRDYMMENAESIQEQYQIENLAEALGLPMSNYEETNDNDQSGLPEYEGLPADFVNEFRAMKEALEGIGSNYEQMQSEKEETENMRMLDNLMEDMHNEHGDFDDRYVISLIASGMSPEDSIEAWNELSESVSSQRQVAPRLMSGPASTPLDQVDMTKLKDPAARKQIGAALLSSLNQ